MKMKKIIDKFYRPGKISLLLVNKYAQAGNNFNRR